MQIFNRLFSWLCSWRKNKLIANPYCNTQDTSKKYSLDVCLVFDEIRGHFFKRYGIYPPMVYFDKHTNSLCFEYAYKELQTHDRLGIAVMLPMFYNNNGKLAVRYIKGCADRIVLIKHDFHFTPMKRPRRETAAASKQFWFSTRSIIDSTESYVIDDDGTVRNEIKIVVKDVSDQDIHDALIRCIDYVRCNLNDYLPTMSQLNDGQIASMIYSEQYDTAFDNLPDILKREATIDSGLTELARLMIRNQ